MTIEAHESAWVEVLAAGTRVGEILVGPQAVKATFEIPAGSLRRGDNRIELRCEKAPTALPRLLRLELSQPSGTRQGSASVSGSGSGGPPSGHS